MGCTGKGSLHGGFVANGPVVAMVVRCFGVQSSAAFGVTHIDHGRQHVIVDFHHFGGI